MSDWRDSSELCAHCTSPWCDGRCVEPCELCGAWWCQTQCEPQGYDPCANCCSVAHATDDCEFANDADPISSSRVPPGDASTIAEAREPTEAERRLTALLDEAHRWVAEAWGRIAVIVTPPGLGKTRKVLERLADESGGTYLAESHPLLDEREEEADALGLVHRQRAYGLLRLPGPNGRPACVYADKLTEWGDRGVSLRSVACRTCKHRDDYRGEGRPCPAYEGFVGVGALFATHAHATTLRLQEKLQSPVLVDEFPPLLETRTIEPRDLLMLEQDVSSPRVVGWCVPLRPIARIIRDAAETLLAEWRNLPPDETLYARRVSGTVLHECLVVAAGSSEALIRARAVLASAQDPWPAPPGDAVRSGRLKASDYPRPYVRDILEAVAAEGTDDTRKLATACLVVEGQGKRARVWLEHRRSRLTDWPPWHSYLILDASGLLTASLLRAALPRWNVRVFGLDVPEPSYVRRLYLRTKVMTRKKLLARRLSASVRPLVPRGARALVRVLRELGERSPPKTGLGILTHKPLALIINACLDVLDGKVDIDLVKRAGALPVLDELRRLRNEGRIVNVRVLWYGNHRGSNKLIDVDVLALIGDPWPDVNAAAEDARTLGIDAQEYCEGLLQAEILQALGRGRAIRRGPEEPLTLVHVGGVLPSAWTVGGAEMVLLPGGGPVPSANARAAQSLARMVAECCGAVSRALLRFLAQRSDLLDVFWRAATGNKNHGPNTSPCPPPGSAELASFMALPGRTQSAACRAATPDAAEVTAHDPIRTSGVWRWRELRPGAAAVLAIVIAELVSRASSNRR